MYIVTRMGKRKGGRRSREYLDILKSSMTKTAGWKEERKINGNGGNENINGKGKKGKITEIKMKRKKKLMEKKLKLTT